MSFSSEDENYVSEVTNIRDSEEDYSPTNSQKENENKNENKKKSGKCINNFIYFLYVFDWILVLFVLAMTELITRVIAKPYKRYLPPNWQENAVQFTYPLKPARFPSWCLVFLFLFPFVTIIVTQIFYKSIIDVHHGILGMLFSFTISEVIAETLKVLGGEFRPNYLALCNPDPVTGDCRDYQKFSSTSPDRSFPSGHTSIAFCLCLYTSLYLSGKMRLFRSEGTSTFKAMIIMLPMLAASVVGITRTMDYFHHFVDITAGSIIGILSAIFGYHIYYPHLWSECEWKPKDRLRSFAIKKKITPIDILYSLVN